MSFACMSGQQAAGAAARCRSRWAARCAKSAVLLALLALLRTALAATYSLEALVVQHAATVQDLAAGDVVAQGGLETATTPLALTGAWTFSGPSGFDPASASLSSDVSWDAAWLPRRSSAGAAVGMIALAGSGSSLLLENLVLFNVKLRTNYTDGTFMMPTFFSVASGAQLVLRNVRAVVDCGMVNTLRLTLARVPSSSSFATVGATTVTISSASFASVQHDRVTVMCEAPPTVQDAERGVTAYSVGTGLQLMNAMALAGSAGNAISDIRLASNISISPQYWPTRTLLPVFKNVTLYGPPGPRTIVDLQGLTMLVYLVGNRTTMSLRNITMINLGLLPSGFGVASTASNLFVAPVWAFLFDSRGVISSSQLQIHNVLLQVPQSELDYLTLWLVMVTTEVADLENVGKQLSARIPEVKAGSGGDRYTLHFELFHGVGIYATNLFVTARDFPPFPRLTSTSAAPEFTLNVISNVTQLPVYSNADLADGLAAVDATPAMQAQPVVFVVRTNLSVGAGTPWPAAGYAPGERAQSFYFTAQTPLFFAYIDFQRRPFISTRAGGETRFLFLTLLNLPNATIDAATAAAAGSSSLASWGEDVEWSRPFRGLGLTLPMWGVGVNNGAARGILNNQTMLVVPYPEFLALLTAVNGSAPGMPPPKAGSPLAAMTAVFVEQLRAPGSYVVRDVSRTAVAFTKIRLFGWSGDRVIITCTTTTRAGLAETLNAYAYTIPPSLSAADAGPDASSGGGGGSDSLAPWQVGLIAAGSAVGAMLLCALGAFFIVRRYKAELDRTRAYVASVNGSTVGGPNSDAKSAKSTDPENNGVPASRDTDETSGSVAPAAAAKTSSARGASIGSDNASARNTAGAAVAVTVGVPDGSAKGARGAASPRPGGGASPNPSRNNLLAPPAPAAPTLPQLDEMRKQMTDVAQQINDQHIQLLEPIGSGASSVVYKAVWKDMIVAVKTITFQDRPLAINHAGSGALESPASAATSAAAIASGSVMLSVQHKAVLEAAISASLAHPNIVSTFCYDLKPLSAMPRVASAQAAADGSGNFTVVEGQQSGSVGGPGSGRSPLAGAGSDWKLYIVQEWCEAGSMRELVDGRKMGLATVPDVVDWDLALDLMSQLAKGMAHLHSKNIVHGDLNPRNVLLKARPKTAQGSGPGLTAKVADFGMATRMGQNQSHVSNFFPGSPFYSAPELHTDGRASKGADMYSYGVILWEVAMQTRCFVAHPRLGNTAHPSFPNLPESVPRPWAKLVALCLGPLEQRPTFGQVGDWMARIKPALGAWQQQALLAAVQAPVAEASPADAPGQQTQQ